MRHASRSWCDHPSSSEGGARAPRLLSEGGGARALVAFSALAACRASGAAAGRAPTRAAPLFQLLWLI